jgi:NAD(P)-dependent dehydrogenase (short-subunit alcohol dehydrogenase family)
MTFDPRYAIVTASDSGIGKATAVALAQSGMDVGVTWHSDSAGAEATAEEVKSQGRKAFIKQLDTTDLPSCAVTIDLLIDELGGLDVFVNNAGTGGSTFLVDTSYDQWRRIIATNLDGAFVCMRQAAKHMVKAGNGGRLIAVTSVHECQPRVGSVPTTPPSTASADWSRPSRWSWATTRSPRTPALRARSHPHDWSGGPRSPSGGTARYPTRPARNAREVAAVIAFLASPRAGYATGASWASTAACCRWGPQAGSHLTSDDWRTA